MANTQSMATSFMGQLMNGGHQFGSITLVSRGSTTAPTTDTFKAALYFASATLNANTTVYSSSNEVTNTSGSGYTAGGVTITNANPVTATNSSTTAGVAYWTPSASFSWTALTVNTAFDCVLVYNSTQNNTAVSVHTFGSQTITAGTFTLTMPSNTTSSALLRLSTT
jgi:hypothetical protein